MYDAAGLARSTRACERALRKSVNAVPRVGAHSAQNVPPFCSKNECYVWCVVLPPPVELVLCLFRPLISLCRASARSVLLGTQKLKLAQYQYSVLALRAANLEVEIEGC